MVGVNYLYPLRQLEFAGTGDIRPRPIAVHADLRRTGELHGHFSRFLLITPSQNHRVWYFSPHPGFGSTGICAHRKPGAFTQTDSLALPEMPGRPDGADGPGCSCIFAGQRTRFILKAIIHVHHTQVPIGFIEYTISAGFTFCIGITPINFYSLPVISSNQGDPYPDARTCSRIPFLDLVCQWQSRGCCKTDILPFCLSLTEIEKILIKPD